MIEYIKNQLIKKGMDDVIVYQSNNNFTQIKFVNNEITKTETSFSNNVSIFAAKNKRLILTNLKDTSKKEIDKKINYILNFIKHIKPNEDYFGIAPGPFKYKEIPDTYDKKIINMNEIDYVERGINTALKNSKRCSGVLEKNVGSSRVISSNNVDVKDKATSLYFSIRAFTTKEASGHMTSCSRTLKKFDVDYASKFASDIAKKAQNPIPSKSGNYDVIFDYLPTAVLLNYVMDSASIFSVETKTSFFYDKLNKKIGNFTLIDQGNLPNGLFSSKCDAEGVPTQKNMVIDKGILKTFLYNTSSAKRHKTKTTANAGLISPQFWNIILEGQKGDVFDIKKGLYITNIWYTRFQNYSTGDFSTIPRDGIFEIENGEIKAPIKNIRVTENMLNILKNLSLMSKDSKQVKSWDASVPTITPKILVKNVKITKPTV